MAVLGDGVVTGVRYRDASGSEIEIDCDFVFVATGEDALSLPFMDTLGVAVDERGFISVDSHMRTSVPNVYAGGDLIGHPMEMFKARLSGVCAARNIMGDDYEFHFEQYPDFFHTTYEVQWTGLSEEEARERYDDVVVIKFPPDGADPEVVPLPLGDGSMLYGFTRPKWTGMSKLLIDGGSRRIVGAHHVGFSRARPTTGPASRTSISCSSRSPRTRPGSGRHSEPSSDSALPTSSSPPTRPPS